MALRKKLGEILIEQGALTADAVKHALGHQRQWGGKLGRILVEMGVIREDQLTRALAAQTRMPTAKLKPTIAPEVAALLPLELAEKHQAIAFGLRSNESSETVYVAVADPYDVDGMDAVRFRIGKPIKFALAPADQIERLIRTCLKGEAMDVPDPFEIAPARPTPPSQPAAGRAIPTADPLDELGASLGLPTTTRNPLDDLFGPAPAPHVGLTNEAGRELDALLGTPPPPTTASVLDDLFGPLPPATPPAVAPAAVTRDVPVTQFEASPAPAAQVAPPAQQIAPPARQVAPVPPPPEPAPPTLMPAIVTGTLIEEGAPEFELGTADVAEPPSMELELSLDDAEPSSPAAASPENGDRLELALPADQAAELGGVDAAAGVELPAAEGSLQLEDSEALVGGWSAASAAEPTDVGTADQTADDFGDWPQIEFSAGLESEDVGEPVETSPPESLFGAPGQDFSIDEEPAAVPEPLAAEADSQNAPTLPADPTTDWKSEPVEAAPATPPVDDPSAAWLSEEPFGDPLDAFPVVEDDPSASKTENDAASDPLAALSVAPEVEDNASASAAENDAASDPLAAFSVAPEVEDNASASAAESEAVPDPLSAFSAAPVEDDASASTTEREAVPDPLAAFSAAPVEDNASASTTDSEAVPDPLATFSAAPAVEDDASASAAESEAAPDPLSAFSAAPVEDDASTSAAESEAAPDPLAAFSLAPAVEDDVSASATESEPEVETVAASVVPAVESDASKRSSDTAPVRESASASLTGEHAIEAPVKTAASDVPDIPPAPPSVETSTPTPAESKEPTSDAVPAADLVLGSGVAEVDPSRLAFEPSDVDAVFESGAFLVDEPAETPGSSGDESPQALEHASPSEVSGTGETTPDEAEAIPELDDDEFELATEAAPDEESLAAPAGEAADSTSEEGREVADGPQNERDQPGLDAVAATPADSVETPSSSDGEVNGPAPSAFDEMPSAEPSAALEPSSPVEPSDGEVSASAPDGWSSMPASEDGPALETSAASSDDEDGFELPIAPELAGAMADEPSVVPDPGAPSNDTGALAETAGETGSPDPAVTTAEDAVACLMEALARIARGEATDEDRSFLPPERLAAATLQLLLERGIVGAEEVLEKFR